LSAGLTVAGAILLRVIVRAVFVVIIVVVGLIILVVIVIFACIRLFAVVIGCTANILTGFGPETCAVPARL
jgi:hypothetical protein